MIVWHCARVPAAQTDAAQINAAIARGAGTVTGITQHCQATRRCPACRARIEALLAQPVDTPAAPVAAVA